MLLHKPFPIPESILASVRQEVLEEIGTRSQFVDHIHFSPELSDQLNTYLGSVGFPLIRGVLGFKRHNTRPSPYQAHIDGDAVKITTASLIIPVAGCDHNTGMVWYSGEFSRVMMPQWQLKWHTEPKILGTVHVVDTPQLCRVDIPHEAYSNGSEARVTVTLRFQGNPQFADLVKLLESV